MGTHSPVLHGLGGDGGSKFEEEDPNHVEEEGEIDEIGDGDGSTNANPKNPLYVVHRPAVGVIESRPQRGPHCYAPERQACTEEGKTIS